MAISPDIAPEDSTPLPEWAARALSAVASRTVQRPSFESLRRSAAWPLLLDAAVVSTFLPRQLAPEASPDIGRPQAENNVLDYSEPAATPEGTRWELRRDARAAVLRLALGQDDFGQALARTAARFGDAVSRALRDTLTGTALKQLESANLQELEAIRAAASLLGGVDSLQSLVPLSRLDRLIRKRRMVEQFERICGKDFKTEVVGRTSELDQLRGYVGVISAESFRRSVSNTVASTRRVITGRKPLAIWGTGGVGKTTLLSRFMLEHIDSAEGSYPFAYLDFDRPSISPKDHTGLFAEICLQMSAQFEALDAPLRALREEALEGDPNGPTSDSESRMESLVEAFRQQVDGFLNDQESLFEWARPVLIVLDTVEVVQYDANQVLYLERFLRHFIKRGWSRLRLIVAGRKRVDNIGTDDEPMALEPMELEGLDVGGASELLVRLARRVSKELHTKAAAELAALLAIKRSILAQPKVHPLRIRMVGNVFKQRENEKESGDDIARALIHELQGGLKGGSSTARALTDGILIRRIVDHVTDPRVKALADPGLVVRRITPEVIELVMVRGTPRPDSKIDNDATDFQPWTVTHQEAEDIYQAFSKEVALVESDGPALRHRQDVRSEMLPLIRARSPHRFEQLHRLAFSYFSQAASATDMPNEIAAAEAVYHGLWSGEPLERLDNLWTRGQVTNSRIDPTEFEPGSRPVLFLKARNREGLTAEEVQSLPTSIAMAWASEYGEQFLLASDPGGAFEVMTAAIGQRLDLLLDNPNLLAVGARLLYRTGAWQDCGSLIRHSVGRFARSRTTSQQSGYASLLRLLSHLNAKSGIEVLLPGDTLKASFEMIPPIARVEVASHLLISGQTAYSDALELAIAESSRRDWLASRRILRLAILASSSLHLDLVAAWVRSSDRFPNFQKAGDRPDQGLEAIFADFPDLGASSSDDKQRPWRQRRVEIAKRIESDRDLAMAVRHAIVFDHSDWQVPFGNALVRGIMLKHKGLFEHLKQGGFIPNRGSTNGRSVVRTAVREGRLLELATTLASLSGDKSYDILPPQWSSYSEAYLYPQSLPSFARALSTWHDRLRCIVSPSAVPNVSTSSQT